MTCAFSVVALILAASAAIGLPIIRAMGAADDSAARRLMQSTGLGLGVLALLMLALGSAGLLDRWLWTALLLALVFTLVIFLPSRMRRRPGTHQDGGHSTGSRGAAAAAPNSLFPRIEFLWLAAAPFAVIAVLLALLPPGLLWPSEGYGYDVLEYHLAAPREYYEAGRIHFLPHNLYSNFPFNVEMLYLLCMILCGGPVEGVFAAQLLNVALAGLFVGAAALGAGRFGRGGATVAGVFAATCPFLTYLCGLAYVENGLLLFSALAIDAWFTAFAPAVGAASGKTDHLRPSGGLRTGASGLLCGLYAGLACGTKYTAVVFVLLPLLTAAGWRVAVDRPRRPKQAALLAFGAMLSFSPWLIKNVICTGNPVFPMARTVFPERPGVWTDEGAARWHEGHLPAPEHRPMGARLTQAWSQIFASPLFGWGLLAVVMTDGILLASRRLRGAAPAHRSAAQLCRWIFIVNLPAWLLLTHLADRFAIPLLIPAALLAGIHYQSIKLLRFRQAIVAGLLLVAALNLGVILEKAHPYLFLPTLGRTDWMLEGEGPVPRLNAILKRGEKVLLVAEARRFYLQSGADYCVVFNPNPFAEAAAELDPPELIRWLRERGYAYVYVHWNEMRRLRGSRYGFWPSIDESLFERLTLAGLRVAEEFTMKAEGIHYATLYAVPPG